MSDARRTAGACEPAHPRGLLHARGAVHAVGGAHLGCQHALPARRGAQLLRGVRRQRGVLGRDGRVRDSDGRRRGHARPARSRFSSPSAVLAATTLLYVGLAEVGRGRRAVRARLRRHGPRVHVLLGCDGGVARRRADVDRVPRAPRPRVRARAASHGRGDAGRHGRRRPTRADRPLAPVRRSLGAPARGLRRRVCGDARPRLRAASGRARASCRARSHATRGRASSSAGGSATFAC